MFGKKKLLINAKFNQVENATFKGSKPPKFIYHVLAKYWRSLQNLFFGAPRSGSFLVPL